MWRVFLTSSSAPASLLFLPVFASSSSRKRTVEVPASLEFTFLLSKPARQTAEAVVRNPSEEPSAVLEYRIARAAEVDRFVNVSKAGGVIPPLGQTDLFTVTVDSARLQARHAPYWFTVTIVGRGVCACDDMGDITLRGAVYVNAELDANHTVLTLDASSVVAGASVAYSYEPVPSPPRSLNGTKRAARVALGRASRIARPRPMPLVRAYTCTPYILSLTHTPTRSLTHLPTHSLTQPLTHATTHSFTHSPTHV